MKGIKRMEKDDREMDEMKREAMQEGDIGGGGGGGQPGLSRDPLLQLTAGGGGSSQAKVPVHTHVKAHARTKYKTVPR